jgi:hypothetical protein
LNWNWRLRKISAMIIIFCLVIIVVTSPLESSVCQFGYICCCSVISSIIHFQFLPFWPETSSLLMLLISQT